jgi:catechol 2,3-dioxygenase-like lactoylglutathione lyase family enzyme
MPNIDHVHIRASDPEKTSQFFQTFFGAEIVKQFESLGRKLTLMAIGNKSHLSILHIAPAVKNPEPEKASIDHIGIAVENIEELVSRLKESGYSFPVELRTSPTTGSKLAFCLGPDNVQLELIQRP